VIDPASRAEVLPEQFVMNRLDLRIQLESDFVVALPFYTDAELRQAMGWRVGRHLAGRSSTASCGRAG
jgi:hypothetical protein